MKSAPSAVEIVALVDAGLGNSSYLVDVGDGRALVVDPSRDPRPYLAAAQTRGLRIAWSVETHLHADFVSGSRELAADGSVTVAPAAGELAFPHQGLAGADELDLGGLTLRALATPGHTPEHLTYLLLDGDRPVALFSGGALIPGGVARPDLLRPELTEPLARAAYRSVRDLLLTLPEDLAVYPTHGPGSFCSSTPGQERTTTVGRELRYHPFAITPDEDAATEQLLAGLGSYPPYFLRLREVNRLGPRVHGDDRPRLPQLDAGEVASQVTDGAVLIDVRRWEDFAAGHVPGSLSIALRDQFATWLGWLVPDDRPLVFVVGDDQDRDELAAACLKVGYERLVGELTGGVDGWAGDGRALATTEVVEPDALEGREIVDVRQDAEWATGHLPGARHVELGDLDREVAALPDGPLAVHCGHGERATTAASVLERNHLGDVAIMRGGPDDWATRTGGRLQIP